MNMLSLRLPLVLLAAAVLAAPAGAVARDTNAPPGNSGIDEYLETVPGAGGAKIPRKPGGGKGHSVLTAAQRKRLARQGRDGRVLAGVVQATAPQTAPKDHPGKPLPESTGRSPLEKTIDALGGSDNGNGLGVLLPAILLATLLGTLVLFLLRRRSAS